MTDHQDPAQPGTDIALLPPADRALIVLKSTETENALLALVERTKPITAPVDKDGREEVHRAAMDHKNARIAIEKAGKTAREDANAFSKAIVAEAARLVAITADEEERLFDLRDTYDKAEAARKAEEERKERERVDAIKAKIHQIADLYQQSVDDSAADLDATITDLMAYEVTFEDFAEYQDEAKAVVSTTLASLATLHDRAVAREAAAKAAAEAEAALAAQREELARAQRELEEQRAAIARERAELEAAKQPTGKPLPEGVEPGQPVNKEGNYYAPDGTFMNSDGTRSIFDDVDEMPDPAPAFMGVDMGDPAGDTQVEAVLKPGEVMARAVEFVTAKPERSMTVEPETVIEQAVGNLNSYYFGFAPTGVAVVDTLLSAIATAGKVYHHTEDWTEAYGTRQPFEGATPVEWMQNAADNVARYLSELEAREEWLQCLEAAGVDNWQGIEEAMRIRRGVAA